MTPRNATGHVASLVLLAAVAVALGHLVDVGGADGVRGGGGAMSAWAWFAVGMFVGAAALYVVESVIAYREYRDWFR